MNRALVGALSVAAFAASTLSANAIETRAHLEQCEILLSACYESCKAAGAAPSTCNNRCSTKVCGLPWHEPFGAFIDRRIEEDAAPQFTKFIGISQLRRVVQ